MVTAYEVLDDGTAAEIEISKDRLDTHKVYCLVDDTTKSIHLWKGSLANVRRKFVGARTASRLRSQQGFHFKVLPQEQGEESPSFLEALDKNK